MYQKSDQDVHFTEVGSVSHDRSTETADITIDRISLGCSSEYRVLLQHDGVTFGSVNTVKTSLNITSSMKVLAIDVLTNLVR